MLVFEEGSLEIKMRDPDSNFWEKITYDIVEEEQDLRLIKKEQSCGFEKSLKVSSLCQWR